MNERFVIEPQRRTQKPPRKLGPPSESGVWHACQYRKPGPPDQRPSVPTPCVASVRSRVTQ